EAFKKGDVVKAVVLNIDRENERFSLGLKQLNQLMAFAQSLRPTTAASSAPTNNTTTDPHLEGITLVAGDQVYYRWQDEDGIWQFTAEPPPKHITDYKPVITNSNVNVIQSLQQDKIDTALGRHAENTTLAARELKQKQSKTAELSQELETLSAESGLPLTNIPKLIEQTKQIRSTMEQRNQALDQL
ncbi:MAG: hypothetical protein P8077_08755, partial [Gammaproteobacteria bacterium]